MMIKEHDRVVLTTDLPQSQLQAGDVGVVVMVHGDHEGYELEVLNAAGSTIEVVTLEASQVRSVTNRDMLHVRALEV